MRKLSNLLLVSGSGRNVGKSTLVSKLIEKFREEKLIAVKVSPHFHDGIPEETPYIIEKELNPDRLKDSSRFLKSGASEVYYLQVYDEHLPEAFEKICEKNIENRPVIAESGGLANYFEAGLLLFVSGNDNIPKNRNIMLKADKVLRMVQGKFDIDDITLVDGEWKLMKGHR